jgi:hypothetical protein
MIARNMRLVDIVPTLLMVLLLLELLKHLLPLDKLAEQLSLGGHVRRWWLSTTTGSPKTIRGTTCRSKNMKCANLSLAK